MSNRLTDSLEKQLDKLYEEFELLTVDIEDFIVEPTATKKKYIKNDFVRFNYAKNRISRFIRDINTK